VKRVHAAPVKHEVSKPPPRHHVAAPRATPHYPSGPTSWGALNASIARIPTYHPGQAQWVVKDTGWWGTADWNTGVIYISPSVPESKLYDVAVHEWSHILTVIDYGGDATLAIAATTAYYGGAGLNGAEDAADCMAILQGADWTHYTSCPSSKWRAGAQQLIDGHRLPVVAVK
jgi:hypothetical protein